MFDSVLDAVVTYLSSNSIPAVRKFPGCVLDRNSDTVTVSLKSGNLTASGCGNYLGVCESNGKVKELYGSRAELKIGIEIYTPASDGHAAAECVELVDDICSCIDGISGVKLRGFESREPEYHEETEMFRCECLLSITAFMVRQADECGGFTDFVLRGELK